MAGSPKKRVREKLARTAAQNVPKEPPVPAPLDGDVLPPVPALEVTQTALKRAMRAKAQGHAEAAITVLVDALKSPDERIRVSAANDLLDRGYGRPTPDIEEGAGGLLVQIIRFSQENQI